MKTYKYQLEVEHIKKNAVKNFSEQKKNYYNVLSEIISANLYNLMPQIPIKKHQEIIKEIFIYQKWAVLDENYPQLIDNLILKGNIPQWNKLHEQPVIFSTYHVGSYRLIAPFLVKMGLKITLLIDSNVAKFQGEKFQQMVDVVRHLYHTDNDCARILDLGMKNVAVKLVRELREKRCLLIYLDGNRGTVGNYDKEEKSAKVNFCGQTLYVRKGIGYFSYLSKAPVIPVITYRKSDNSFENVMKFFDPIFPGNDEQRETYSQNILQSLYTILEKQLTYSLEQWESWRYIEKSLSLKEMEPIKSHIDWKTNEKLLSFNNNRYAIVRVSDEGYALFDRSSYRSVLLSDSFLLFLNSIKKPCPVPEILEHSKITDKTLSLMHAKEIVKLS